MHFEMTPEQYRLLSENAKACGLSKRAYLIHLLQGHHPVARQNDEMKALRREIHAIGNNINQIARSVNAGIATQEDGQEAQYPPRVTGKMRQEVMRFEQLRAQFQFLNENGIATEADMQAFAEKAEAQIKTFTKQRTILNVQKKKRQPVFRALAEEEALAPAKRLYDQGHSGMEQEAQRYMEAVKLLDGCSESREALSQQQAELYTKLADLNRELRQVRKQIKMCKEIRAQATTMQENIREIEVPERQRQSRHRERT